MYLSTPLMAHFKDYDEKKVQERRAVDKYITELERQVFFTSNGALV